MVTPSFAVILLIATLLTKLLKYSAVKAVPGGIRPAVIGMILSTALTMSLGLRLKFKNVETIPTPNFKVAIIFTALLSCQSAAQG